MGGSRHPVHDTAMIERTNHVYTLGKVCLVIQITDLAEQRIEVRRFVSEAEAEDREIAILAPVEVEPLDYRKIPAKVRSIRGLRHSLQTPDLCSILSEF